MQLSFEAAITTVIAFTTLFSCHSLPGNLTFLRLLPTAIDTSGNPMLQVLVRAFGCFGSVVVNFSKGIDRQLAARIDNAAWLKCLGMLLVQFVGVGILEHAWGIWVGPSLPVVD